MPCFVYKCDTCGRIEERLDIPVEKRNEEYPCDEKITVKMTYDRFACLDVIPVNNEHRCKGSMIFQSIASMKGGSFKFHDADERKAQYGE